MIYNRHAKRSAARKTTSAANASHETPRSRILMILLAFVALTIQTLVVQSHIHIRQAASKVQSVSLITLAAGTADTGNDQSAGAPRDKYPINEDPSNCPLCQEIAHSGQFLQSAATLAAIPASVSIHFIIFNEALPSFFAVSHNWHSRAPPQH